MEPEYWLKRWQDNRTGWHHDKPMPLLVQHWPALELPHGTRVLVPLCGKSRDMLWLAGQGMHVLGVEISAIAIDSFLTENDLHANVRRTGAGARYEITDPPGGSLEIIHGDVFEVGRAALASCRAIYDRAALVALPTPVRRNYARDIYGGLPDGCRCLLITLEYPPQQMEGPPFSVDDNEVRHLFEAGWEIERLEHRDILASQPHFSEQGVTALHTAVYRMDKRHR